MKRIVQPLILTAIFRMLTEFSAMSRTTPWQGIRGTEKLFFLRVFYGMCSKRGFEDMFLVV